MQDASANEMLLVLTSEEPGLEFFDELLLPTDFASLDCAKTMTTHAPNAARQLKQTFPDLFQFGNDSREQAGSRPKATHSQT